ncbi:MAG: transglutaminase domain-containing protein [Bacteroidales bacterium]
MRISIIIIFTFFILKLSAQNVADYSTLDKVALQVPDSMTHSSSSLARYFNSKFQKESDKSRAAFIWIVKNIQYDVANMFAINYYQNSSETVEKVLKKRRGVCIDFAELYCDILQKCGITSYVISGYTKQNGFVDYIPHAWCAGYIDSNWMLFDPTWGSGYVMNSKFVRQTNNYYYKTKPSQLIKSHIPFDPMWQLQSYPITNQEFYEGKFNVNAKNRFFNYQDSITQYFRQSEVDKLVSSARRVDANGVKNSLVFDQLQHIKREIEYIQIQDYNKIVAICDNGVNQLNEFINFRNRQFTPKKSDEEIKEMITNCEKSFVTAQQKVNEIKNPCSNLQTSLPNLNKIIKESMLNLNEQKTFLTKYFGTNKLFRKALFYKYTWMGVPIN